MVLASWAVLALLSACSRQPQQSALDRLQPCALDDGPTDAYCGVLPVFENRRVQQGRRINLSIVVLPALSNDAQPDPLFFLAGGPGQAAARMAREVRDLFKRIQQRRDIVLVDQRGTGKSNPLDCKPASDSLSVLNESDEAGFERLRKCLRDGVALGATALHASLLETLDRFTDGGAVRDDITALVLEYCPE